MALAEKHFGSWSGGAAAKIAIPAPASATAGKIYLVDRQDAAQTVVSQFLAAPAIGSADDDALTLADSVWGGGGFGTRLNLNLREDKGYSYGVFSALVQYAWRRHLVRRRRRADRQDRRVGRRVRQGAEGPRGRSAHLRDRARELAPAATARHLTGV